MSNRDKIDKKYAAINYTSRDFNSLRTDLINYAKRYYPETVKDFTEASFASLMIDSVAYVGDILSFYLDYQLNESFLASANDYENIIRLAKQVGYKFKGSPSAYGAVTFYTVVPANSQGLGPDSRYIPILKKNSILGSTGGVSFVLTQDVRFDNPGNETVPARINQANGLPSSYAIRSYGSVISGRFDTYSVDSGPFQKFKRIRIPTPAVAEIISVFDSSGNEYFEVDYLSQDIVYKTEINTDPSTKQQTPSLLIPFAVPRRFVVERNFDTVDLIFGHGSEAKFLQQNIAEPSNVLIERFGRNYVTDDIFDPSNLISNEQFGIAPADTRLNILYRLNDTLDINAPAGTINKVTSPILDFNDTNQVPASVRLSVQNSFECSNEAPITTARYQPNAQEIKRQATDFFAAQSRAVTAQDYESIIYHLPPEFGSITRVRAVKDNDSLKRNINIYVLSTNTNNVLQLANSATKNNIKNWINKYRMINDTVDILDARVVNLGIEFTIYVREPYDKNIVLQECLNVLRTKYTQKMFIGESFNMFDIYGELNRVQGVADVADVKLTNKRGSGYSGDYLNVKRYMSADGRKVIAPENTVFEVRYPINDIKGTVK